MKNAIQFKLTGRSPLGQHGQTVTLDKGRVYVDGKLIQLSLQPTDVHLPEELPTYLAGYRPFPFRADEASPVIPVDKDEDYHRDFSSNNAFRRVDVKASIEGNIPEVDPLTSTTKFKVVDRLLGAFVPQVTEENASGLYKPRQAAMKRVANAVALDREIDVWTLLSTSGSWAAGNVVTLGATFQWNEGGSANPLKDVQDRIIASAQPVTDIWVNQEVGFAFLRNAAVRDQMRQYLGDGAPANALATVAQAGTQNVDFAIPGLPPFHVAAAKVLNETSGLLEFVLTDACILVTRPPGIPTDAETVATTYTFRRRGGAGVGFETREFRIEGRGAKGGTMVVVNQADIAQMTGNNCGGLILNCIQ